MPRWMIFSAVFVLPRSKFSYAADMRIVSLIIAAAILHAPALAQEAKEQTSSSVTIEVAPVDPVKKKAEEIDKLFGELQQEGLNSSGNTIAKIWTLWESNPSPTAELLLTQSGRAMKDGAFETSEEMLNTLIGSYPEFVEALSKRAMLYYNQKRYDEAMVDLDAVLETEPRHFGALSGKAAVFQAQGQYAKAAAALRDAIAVNPYLESAKIVLKQLEHDYPDI
jgi:tetratricopeptide (TPR) repeat protein